MVGTAAPRGVFVTGANGYLGNRLVPALLARGHRVGALVRPGREGCLPAGCRAIVGDALDAASFQDRIGSADTLVHLVGVAHPGPGKAQAFREVDLASVHAARAAARHAGIAHFVYVSVARPAPVMAAYQAARAEGEALLAGACAAVTFLQPWYVLGPGHRWPLALLPAYWLAERLPATRDAARRLGLVTREQMVAALAWAVDNPAPGTRSLGVPEIRQLGS